MGIIILIGAILYYSIKKEVITTQLAPGVELTVEEIPVEFMAIRSFIDNCLTQTATEGLVKIGERGGFINLVENGIATKADSTNSDAVQFSPHSEYSIPYWWYLSSDNKCSGNCQFSAIPDNKLYLTKTEGKTSIEGQLEKYLEDNLRNCLADFKVLEAQGYKIEEKGAIKPIVNVAANDIIIYIDYPIEAEKAGKQSFSKFFVRLPVNIGKIYAVASSITNLEGQYHYLEKDVLSLIVGFSGVDEKKLPPMSDTKFRIGEIVTWKKSKVKQDIINMLASYIQLLQVYGTKNYRPLAFPGNPLFESLYNQGMLVLGSNEYSNLEIKFNYNPFWKIYLNLNCDGEICKPESIVTDLAALLGIQRYEFVYDLSFPVEVEIHDTSAFNNRGYKFRFFLEGNIRNNDVMKSDFIATKPIKLTTTMLCDENKRNSGDITINIEDSITNEALDDVQIAYSSGTENCLIGSTKNGTFIGKFPVMLGGVTSFIKDRYVSYSQRLDTQLAKKEKLDVSLNPILNKKFIVKKKLMKKEDGIWNPPSEETELLDEEEASVRLIRKASLQEGEFQTMAVYAGNQSEPGEIDIAPGRYEISIDLMYNKPLRIPPDEREEGDEEFTIQEVNLNEGFRVGGLAINYTFTKENLQKDEIIFYALNPDIVSVPESHRVIEDLNFVNNADELSQRYKGTLVPQFK